MSSNIYAGLAMDSDSDDDRAPAKKVVSKKTATKKKNSGPSVAKKAVKKSSSKGGKREKDRHVSGTGRDRSMKKGGNGRGNWGKATDVAVSSELAEGEEAAAVVEEPDNSMTYDEYLASKKTEIKNEELFAETEERAVEEHDDLVAVSGVVIEDAVSGFDGLISKKAISKKTKTSSKTKGTFDAALLFRNAPISDFREERGDRGSRGGRGRGRGRGRGGSRSSGRGRGRGGSRGGRGAPRGDRGGKSKAPPAKKSLIADSDFPALG